MTDSVYDTLGLSEVADLLASTVPARLAFVAVDGSPRVQPIWFHWNGRQFVMCTGADTPKAKAIRKDPRVAFTIDTEAGPYRSLQVRGLATLEVVPGVPTEYELAAERYYGKEVGARWIRSVLERRREFARITIEPTWAHYMNVGTIFPTVFE